MYHVAISSSVPQIMRLGLRTRGLHPGPSRWDLPVMSGVYLHVCEQRARRLLANHVSTGPAPRTYDQTLLHVDDAQLDMSLMRMDHEVMGQLILRGIHEGELSSLHQRAQNLRDQLRADESVARMLAELDEAKIPDGMRGYAGTVIVGLVAARSESADRLASELYELARDLNEAVMYDHPVIAPTVLSIIESRPFRPAHPRSSMRRLTADVS